MIPAAGLLRRSVLPALLVAVAAVLYGRTLAFEFVNYDDYDLIVMNSSFLADRSNVIDAFSTHAFSGRRDEGVYYRPILIASYFVDYARWGLNPLGYHLTNVLLHAGATVLMFLFGLTVLRQAERGGAEGRPGGEGGTREREGGTHDRRNRAAAFFAALLFSVHPVQVESVAWIAGRNDLLLGFLLLASFYCYALQYRGGGHRWAMFAISMALFAAAVLTKESALFYLPLYPLYELVVRGETPASLFGGRNHLKASVSLAIAAGYLALRYNILGAFVGAEKLYGLIPMDNRFLMAPGMALTNLLFLLWPSHLSIVHPLEKVPWFEFPGVIAAVAVSAGALVLFAVTVKRDPALSWSVAWVIAGMLPLLNVFPLAVPILEHRLYAVAPGFALAAALAAMKIRIPAGSRAPSTGAVTLGAVCLILAVLAWNRVPVWRNSEVLWLDAIEKEPAAPRAYFNLAGYYFERGEFDRTAGLLERYVDLKPEDFTGYAKLRQTYFLSGRPADAARVCRTLIARDPGNVSRYLEAGVLFERMGLSDSVVAVYREGLNVNPGFFQLHRRLGSWYAAGGDSVRSRVHLRAADSIQTAGRVR